jgi:hypothetical protein
MNFPETPSRTAVRNTGDGKNVSRETFSSLYQMPGEQMFGTDDRSPAGKSWKITGCIKIQNAA